MSEPATTTPEPTLKGEATKSTRARSIGATFLGTFAVLGLAGSMLGFWTIRTATDSERFERRVEELLVQEEISDGLARRVVGEVADTLGIRDAAIDVVPEVLEPAIDLLLAGVRSRVEDRMGEAIRTPEVAGTVAAAAGRAHGEAVDVLEGESVVDGVEVVGGEVRVNLLPLVARTITTLQEIGLFSDVVVPELDRAGDPAVQRAELAAALGRDLPEQFGEPVIFRSESLDRLGTTVELAQDTLLLAKRSFWLLFVVGIGLAAVAIRLSRQRWRSASFIVAGLFFVALVIRVLLGRATSRLPELVVENGAKQTIRQVATGLEQSLNEMAIVYALLGLAVLVVAAAVRFGGPAWRARHEQAT